MKVSLISYTPNARELLIYTKSTRLTQGANTRELIASMSEEEKQAELEYMAGTIPGSWEFVDYVFEIQDVSRAFTHQFVRTRQGSYAQQTQRMLDMGDFNYVTGPTIAANPSRQAQYDSIMRVLQHEYAALISSGAAIEDARGILPTNICTNIIAKFNLRTLSEMAKSRTGIRTQGEYQKVFAEMLHCILEVHPWARMFLFPDKLGRVKALESIIEDGKTGISDALATHAHKIIDQIKKWL